MVLIRRSMRLACVLLATFCGCLPATPVPRDTTTLELVSCTSREGLHTTALCDGAPVSHRYESLGYDVDSTCPPDVWQPAHYEETERELSLAAALELSISTPKVRLLVEGQWGTEVNLPDGVLVIFATDFANDEGTTRSATLLCGEDLLDDNLNGGCVPQ